MRPPTVSILPPEEMLSYILQPNFSAQKLIDFYLTLDRINDAWIRTLDQSLALLGTQALTLRFTAMDTFQLENLGNCLLTLDK